MKARLIPTAESPLALPEDLTNRDREPIHVLGTIQPHGVLVATTTDWIVAHVSAKCTDLFGRGPAKLLGHKLATLLPVETLRILRDRMAALQGVGAVERLFGIDATGDGSRYDLAVPISGLVLVFELEPSEPEAEVSAVSTVRSLIGRLQLRSGFDEFCHEAARRMRAITSFDPVMVCRLHPDGSGEVSAEAARAGLEPYLGLRYPASDIPQQARRLYERNWLRLIADVDAVPLPLAPRTDPSGEPLDLSMSVLRAVSPIHIEYLRNMGVAALMSVTFLKEGWLRGLFACHHNTPHLPGIERRTAAELFEQMVSLLLESRSHAQEAEYAGRARLLHDRQMASMAAEASAFDKVPPAPLRSPSPAAPATT